MKICLAELYMQGRTKENHSIGKWVLACLAQGPRAAKALLRLSLVAPERELR